jgi:hypothetical protein
MTEPDSEYRRALDRSLPLEERRAAYRRWADEYLSHVHPGKGRHAHAGGNRPHDHRGGPR